MGATQYNRGFTQPDTKKPFFTEDYLAGLVLAVSPDDSEYQRTSSEVAAKLANMPDYRNPYKYGAWYE
jgi:hypothetical protein